MRNEIEASPAPALAELDLEKSQSANTETTVRHDEEMIFPGPQRAAMIMVSVYLARFLISLDRTILATAIPKITDEFHSITDVGWYASSYLLTSCAFQLLYGRIYTFYSPKWVLLSSVGLFEVGSALCGAASNSKAFIVGRAVAGLGSAGISSGAINIMVLTIPLHLRPLFQGIFDAIFGVASVAGPLVGGAFTTKISWRWCFYINLPIGAIVVVVLFFLLEAAPSKNTDSLRQQILKLDPLGTLVFLPGVICILLALQWGGTTYPWSSARIIVLFALGSVLLVIFMVIQFKSGDNGTIPIRIIKNRSIASGIYFCALSLGAMMTVVYYLPLYFQAIKGVSAFRSGINTIPLVGGLVFASVVAGIITVKTGYYVGQLIACSFIMSIGAGLLTTLAVDSSTAKWIGYQIIFGLGLGLGSQQAGIAAQTCLEKQDVMTGVVLMSFFQGFGGAVWVSVSQVVFQNSLVKKLVDLRGGITITPEMVINTGATEISDFVPAEVLPQVLKAYNGSLQDVFKVALACAAMTIISGLTMEWKSVKRLKQRSEVSPPTTENIESTNSRVSESEANIIRVKSEGRNTRDDTNEKDVSDRSETASERDMLQRFHEYEG